MKSYLYQPLIAITVSITLLACGGDGGGGTTAGTDTDDGSNSAVALNTGFFIDSPVKGLRYNTDTQYGYTDSEGRYKYIDGEMVQFSIGDVQLPLASASRVITPYDLGDDSTAVNIARFLLSMNTDTDDYTLQIPAQAHEVMTNASLDFSMNDADFSPQAQSILDNITDISGGPALVNIDYAQSHLTGTMKELSDLPQVPDEFSESWFDGRTLYLVWYGRLDGIDADGAGVNKMVFGPNNTVSVTGIYGNSGYAEGYYGVSNGRLALGEAPESINYNYYNEVVCDSSPYYIKTHYFEGNERDNVDLFFFDENRAVNMAKKLTRSIPGCNEADRTVPFAFISVDGSASEWTGIEPIDSYEELESIKGNPTSGMSAKDVYVAQDDKHAYVMFNLKGSSMPNSGYYSHRVELIPQSGRGVTAARFVNTEEANDIRTSLEVVGETLDPYPHILLLGNTLELSIDLNFIDKTQSYSILLFVHNFGDGVESPSEFWLRTDELFYFQ